jgi:hypothetical protein
MNNTTPEKELRFLENGRFFADRGLVVASAFTKAGLIRWMQTNYPKAKRKRSQEGPDELYFEDVELQEWYRCERTDRCPLVT